MSFIELSYIWGVQGAAAGPGGATTTAAADDDVNFLRARTPRGNKKHLVKDADRGHALCKAGNVLGRACRQLHVSHCDGRLLLSQLPREPISLVQF